MIEAIGGCVAVFFDEFDRLSPSFDRRLFAETIKAVSDKETLIGEHASIERNLKQVNLKEMSQDEIREIVIKGLEALKTTMEKTIISDIVNFSCGYPTLYTLIVDSRL